MVYLEYRAKENNMEKKIKEYTVNLDIQIFAETEEKAIEKLPNIVGGKYWFGDITEEKRG